MSVNQEIPDTEAGMNLYVNYCIKEKRRIKNLSRTRARRIEATKEKALLMGMKLNIVEKEDSPKEKR